MKASHAVLLTAAILLFWDLGGHDLWAPDEPYFAEGAREMVADGEWLVPHVNGVVTTDKPPLFFWLIALFSLPGGAVTSFTARLPSALAALGSLALTLRLGERLFDRRIAALAAALLATNQMFWERGRWAHIDSLLCFLILVALCAFEAYRSGEADGRRAGLLFWTAAALATLAKGPVGFLLPLGIALSVLAWDRRMGSWRGFAPLSGPVLFGVILAAWMALAALWGPAEYSVWGALREHFVDRAIHGLHHQQPAWYYLERLPIILLPWTGLLPGALLLAWRRRSAADRFLFAATVFVVLFFTVSTEKRNLYVLPAVPAVALMMASFVGEVAGWNETPSERRRIHRRWLTVGHGTMVTLFVVVAIALPFLADRIEEVSALHSLSLSAALLGGSAAALYLLRRRRPVGFVLATGGSVAVVYLLVVGFVYPSFESRKSARPLAERVEEVTEASRRAGLPVLAYAIGNLPEPIAFYSDGVYTEETADPGRLREHLARRQPAFALIDRDELLPIEDRLPPPLCLIHRARHSRIDVLLVSNRPYGEAECVPPTPAGPGEATLRESDGDPAADGPTP